jgi:hypothetical protein
MQQKNLRGIHRKQKEQKNKLRINVGISVEGCLESKPRVERIRILSIWNKMESLHFMV